ncbi:secretory phospholipase A2 receptor-like [Latimeria chalumnae]|uniref:secretory phospholipase A2 receptor-like n=1 Tax=Latimeria chalumnae TaxID=7897 RepID=UPI00313C7FDA
MEGEYWYTRPCNYTLFSSCNAGTGFPDTVVPVSSDDKTFVCLWSGKGWSVAQQACRTKYTDLVSIHSQEDVEKLPSSFYYYVWIGLYFSVNDSSWKWSNGNSIHFTNWASGEPNSSNHCAVLFQGLFYSKPCTDFYASSCYTDNPLITDNATYTFVWSIKPWSAAKRACQTNFTNLVSIESKDDNKKFTALFYHVFWIGLSYNTTNNDWEWSNGNPVNFTNWGTREPRNSTLYPCVYMKLGSWYTTSCSQYLRFLCYKDGGSPDKDPPMLDSTQYNYNITLSKKSWDDGQKECRTNATDFVSVHSKVDIEMLSALNTVRFWIGLFYDRSQKIWQWSNGDAVSNLTNWGVGEPNDLKTDHCVLLEGGYMYTRPCSYKYFSSCFTGNKILGSSDTLLYFSIALTRKVFLSNFKNMEKVVNLK